MRTFDDMTKARNDYRAGMTKLLTLGGMSDRVPTTEHEWVLFNTNQTLRNIGVQQPLPWPDTPPAGISTPEELFDAIDQAKAAAR